MPRKKVIFDRNNPPEPTTRAKALACRPRPTHYYTGEPCAKGHVTLRYTSTGGCLYCLHPPEEYIRRGDGQGFDWAPCLKVPIPPGITNASAFWRALHEHVQGHVSQFCSDVAHDLKADAVQSLRLRISSLRLRLDEPERLHWRDGRPDEANPDYVTGDARALIEAEILELQAKL